MEHIELQPATEFSADDLRVAMNDAFSDYSIPMRLSVGDFEHMMIQRGLDRRASRVAVIDGRIAAFWYMSIRANRAYLISSGTLPAFRGQGVSGRIARDVVHHLRAEGILSFQTEVLEGNTVAQRLYARIGSRPVRMLRCAGVDTVSFRSHTRAQLEQRSWSEIAEKAPALRGWRPTWQNGDASLMALGPGVDCICAEADGALVGYIARIVRTNTIAQMAIAHEARRQGIGSALLAAAFDAGQGAPLRFINYDADDAGFADFLSAHAVVPSQGQIELAMDL